MKFIVGNPTDRARRVRVISQHGDAFVTIPPQHTPTSPVPSKTITPQMLAGAIRIDILGHGGEVIATIKAVER